MGELPEAQTSPSGPCASGILAGLLRQLPDLGPGGLGILVSCPPPTPLQSLPVATVGLALTLMEPGT